MGEQLQGKHQAARINEMVKLLIKLEKQKLILILIVKQLKMCFLIF